jgi:Lrp/AsnC family transcriptional regulator for asnA, asnC and gidA
MYKIDKIDKNIVDLVMEDGRMSCAEIARRIGGASERMVRYRLERLISEGVIAISAIVNPKALGFPVYADVWIEVEAEKILEVAQKMSQYDCISYVACSIGETDVSVQIIARDTQEVYRFVTGVIGKTPGVRKTTSSIVPLVIKDVYNWHIPEEVCGDHLEEANK